ncbi:DUF3047 domain-containing protein [Desulfacinum infernum]|nr:DUF3047 domain-containing protein [Desulfacinum infernum]
MNIGRILGRRRLLWVATATLSALMVLPARGGDRIRETTVIRETFDTLDDWEPLTFPKIPRHTRYRIEQENGNNVLRADADASASALVHRKVFSARDFPWIRWRWKIEKVLSRGDATRKAGDDYPIRIYVIFRYDPDKASFGQRLKYGAAKAFYGRYPPHSTLNYIWANRKHPSLVLPNTYTDRAMMFLLEQGRDKAGRWVEEERNILDDYRTAFGKDPPDEATVAVMCDTDNTGERTTAWVDDLVVFRKEAGSE